PAPVSPRGLRPGRQQRPRVGDIAVSHLDLLLQAGDLPRAHDMPGAYQEHGLDGGAACDVDQFIDVLLRVLKDVEHGQEETAALGDFWESVPDSLSGCDTTW